MNVKSYNYDPFGNIRNSNGTANTNYRFNTQQNDPESGMYYLRARYYDPATGRFITRDPIKGTLVNSQTQNPYAYAGNNPINNSDPSGKFWDYLPDAVFIGIDIVNCDWGSAIVDTVLGIAPGVPALFGTTKRVIQTADKVDDAAKLVNKINHIFGESTTRHGLTDFVNAFDGNETNALRAVQGEMQKLAGKGKLPQDFTGGITVMVNGFALTVKGKIVNGIPEIGTFFIPK